MTDINQAPLVSIICTVYNHAPYIRQCLDGFVMQQTTFPYEIIVHDDASTDYSAEIIREYADKFPGLFVTILQKENQYSKGVPIGKTFMYPIAKGKYLALCEGDDYWTDPLKLQKQVDAFERDSSIGLVWGRAHCYYQRSHRFGDFFGKRAQSSEELLNDNVIPTATTMIRRDIVNRYYSEICPENHSWPLGDYPLWIFASLNSSVEFLDEEFATYRVLAESASHSKDFHKQESFINGVFDMKEFFINKYGEYGIDRNNERRLVFLMSNAIEYGERKKALEYYKLIQAPSRKEKLKAFCCRFHLIWLIKLSRG